MSTPASELSTQPIGEALANEVADLLVRGLCFAPGHRDYGGMGLCYRDGAFVYSEVNDGEIFPPDDLYCHRGTDASECRSFADKAAFVAWLAPQTDLSLAGLDLSDPWLHRNQRITRERLERAVAHARGKPPELWHPNAW